MDEDKLMDARTPGPPDPLCTCSFRASGSFPNREGDSGCQLTSSLESPVATGHTHPSQHGLAPLQSA